MKTKLFTALIIATAVAASPFATAGHNKHKDRYYQGNKHKFTDYAKVVDVDPIYKTVRISTPERQCWYEEVRKPIKRHVRHKNNETMLIGGIIGGVVGHHLGEGRNRDVATLAGTLIGSAIGRDAGVKSVHTGEYQVSQERHCETHTSYRTEEQLQGYRVTYRYKGELFTTKMQHHPGKRIRVKVHVSPVDKDYY